MTHDPSRRGWLRAAARLTAAPLACGGVFTALVAGCADKEAWPEGMRTIKWDRDTCARCSMVISDPRFAVQVRGGPRDETFKFDDVGCAAMFGVEKRTQHPWFGDSAVRWWVADVASEGKRWLDAREANFLPGVHSPMGYDFGAFAEARPGSIGFTAMLAQVKEAGR